MGFCVLKEVREVLVFRENVRWIFLEWVILWSVKYLVSDRVVILAMRQVKTAFKSLRGLD